MMRALAFRMKVRWFRDILRCTGARRYLWRLYFAGEAYEELHPEGVYIDRLPAPWGRLLARHLADETRHARVFEALLADEGCAPQALADDEDLGWTLLHTVVPDVVAAGRVSGLWPDALAARYMGFLHALEARSISDLRALRSAAVAEEKPDLAAALDGILRDERFHAAYTLRALVRLAGGVGPARRVFAPILRSEHRGYTAVVGNMLARFEELGAVPATALGRLRWWTMKLAVRLGVAFPRLPHLSRVPQGWHTPDPPALRQWAGSQSAIGQ